MPDLFSGNWIFLGGSNFISPFEFNEIIPSVPRNLAYFKIVFSSQWADWENSLGGEKLRSFLKMQERYANSSEMFIYEERKLVPSSTPLILSLPPAPGNSGVRSFFFRRFFWSHRWAKRYTVPEDAKLFFPLSINVFGLS